MEATAKPYEGAAPELGPAVGGELDPERIIRTQPARARAHLQHIEPALVETPWSASPR
ncbi:MAG: hypothetical protein P8Y27_17815 [Chromatiaceae bacterium]